MLYSFAGSTIEKDSLIGINYYCGVGINFFEFVRFETQFQTLGLQISFIFGSFSIDLSVNVLEMFSMNVGWTTDLGNGCSNTDVLTFGINVGFVLFVLSCVYGFFQGQATTIPETIYV